ncbi:MULTISPECIES: molecular chaperone DnaJ [Phocaeicola]|uniref:molecular chaperone DnaJ n=1 Tax=Phocaeicola TaxID=909656 RepID=UPI00293B9303|nr:molecular chaperone DnaJ [Phocaeicola massiliensis]
MTKSPKIALCRVCHGTGQVKNDEYEPCVCTQCGGSGRVTVSANIELDIRPYKPKKE